MPLSVYEPLVLGTHAERGDAYYSPGVVYIESDTGSAFISDGSQWRQFGGGALPPGIASDLSDGLAVDGAVNVGDGTHDGTVTIHLKPGQTAAPFTIVNASNQIKFSIAVDGETITADDLFSSGWIKAIEAVSAWGVTGPTSRPLLATGAGATVDDVIALLQSYGFCKQS